MKSYISQTYHYHNFKTRIRIIFSKMARKKFSLAPSYGLNSIDGCSFSDIIIQILHKVNTKYIKINQGVFQPFYTHFDCTTWYKNHQNYGFIRTHIFY